MKTIFLLKKNFKEYLKLRGWNARAFAQKIGYGETQVSGILNRKIEPSMRFLHDLCELTGLKLEEVIETVNKK